MEMAREDGKLPKALQEMPKLDPEYRMFIQAHDALSIGQPIPYSEMDSYLKDYPEIEPRRFKVLLRTLDMGFLK